MKRKFSFFISVWHENLKGTKYVICCISCAALLVRRLQASAFIGWWSQAKVNLMTPIFLLSQHVGPGRSTVQGTSLGSLVQVSKAVLRQREMGTFLLASPSFLAAHLSLMGYV